MTFNVFWCFFPMFYSITVGIVHHALGRMLPFFERNLNNKQILPYNNSQLGWRQFTVEAIQSTEEKKSLKVNSLRVPCWCRSSRYLAQDKIAG